MRDSATAVTSVEDELAKIHIFDSEHHPVELDPPKPPDAMKPGAVSAIWHWPAAARTTDAHRQRLADRFVAEGDWVQNLDGTWQITTLVGETVTIADDPRGTWQYSSWPSSPATKPPVDDNNAMVTARTIWGELGENTRIDIRDENGFRVVEGEYLLGDLPTGVRMRAVLDGGLVVYADGWCHPPSQIRSYEKPAVIDVLSVWNRSARGTGATAVRWKDAYTTAISLDGECYLLPAYEFTDKSGNVHVVAAIDPAVIRVHPPKPLDSPASAVV